MRSDANLAFTKLAKRVRKTIDKLREGCQYPIDECDQYTLSGKDLINLIIAVERCEAIKDKTIARRNN